MTPTTARGHSGRILLRLPSGLHAGLKRAASAAGLSMNDYCTRKLAGPCGDLGAVTDAVLRAAATFGEDLRGVVVFGSWPRGEHGAGSDVDLLVVLERSVPIRRDLYRRWDEEPLRWEGRPVEPHFVHLRALDVLYEAESWADVVRESQEAVELALEGLLRASGVEPPRIHDVLDVLLAEAGKLPAALRERVQELARISKEPRRDRELAFYGAEDLTPTAFYSEEDARRARDGARRTVGAVSPHVPARA